MNPPKFRKHATGLAPAARAARIFHTTHETPTGCGRRREEADHLRRPIHPPIHDAGAPSTVSASFKCSLDRAETVLGAPPASWPRCAIPKSWSSPHVGGYEGCEKPGLAACFRNAITLLTAFGFLMAAVPARAAGTVSSCSVAGLVNALQGGGLVTVHCNSVFVFTNTITITNDTVIDAAGYAPVFSGDNTFRLFNVESNVNFALISVVLINGNATGTNGADGADGGNSSGVGGNGHSATGGDDGFAGAIYNLGYLWMTNCFVTNNSVVAGNGGDGGNGGNGDYAGGNGGAGGNAGKALGGAIYNAGMAFLTNCTIANNAITGGDGGNGGSGGSGTIPGRSGGGQAGGTGAGAGIFNRGTLTIRSSTFSNNSARGGDSMKAGTASNGGLGSDGDPGGSGLGGGIYSTGILAVVNCTFASNTTIGGKGGDGGDGDFGGGDGGNGGLASGGGIYSAATAAITNCTLSANSATGGTNGLAGSGAANGAPGLSRGGSIARGAGAFVLANSIIANAASGGNGYGTFTDAGYNISSDNSLNLTAAGSLKNINANLGTLSSNGGPTQTIMPLIGSPAVDRGSAFGNCLAVDQRGISRPQGTNCDVGAVETAGLTLQTQPQNQTVTNGANVTFSVTATGDSPITYQWRFNNTNRANATNFSLTLANVQPTNAGNYLVVVANPSGARTSSVAVLKVFTPFSMTGPSLSNKTNFFFTVSSQTGFTYYVEYKSSLNDSNWIRLRTNVGNGNIFTNLVPIGGTTSRFFRVSAQ